MWRQDEQRYGTPSPTVGPGSVSGRSTPLSLEQEMKLGISSWASAAPPPPLSSTPPPDWHDEQRGQGGVHGGTGMYAYSITSNKKQPKSKNWRAPAAAIKFSQALGRPARGPTPLRQPQSESAGIASQYGRPASSIYPQPSPEAAVFAAHQLRKEAGYADPLEISPPSSPDFASPRNRHNRDVSPIDELDDMAQVTGNGYGAQQHRSAEAARSNIPTMRRERRKNSDAARLALREKNSQERIYPQRSHDHSARWDLKTGEPTSADNGRKSKIHPQAYAGDLTRRENSYPSPPRAVQPPSQQQTSSFGQRIARQMPSVEPEFPQSRPAWQGGSGRMALAEPLRESDNAPPLVVPPRNANRPPPGYTSPPARSNGVLSPVHSMGSSGRLTPTMATSPASKGRPGFGHGPLNQALSSQYPSPPPERQRPSPVTSTPWEQAPLPPTKSRQPQQLVQPLAEMQPQTQAPDVRDTLTVPATEKPIKRKPAGHQARPSWSSSVYSTSSQPQTPVAPTAATPESDSTQPTLQTRTTSNTYTSHHRGATLPPPQPETPGQSVLDRKRPILAGTKGQRPQSPPTENVIRIDMSSPYQRNPANANGSKPTKKPLEKQGLFNGSINDSVRSLLPEFKTLPPAPPEDEAEDRAAQLNAKLSALANRRMNIHTAIKQMTELMPTDNVLASEAVLRKREGEKRKIETLKLELAEIEHESYEVGIKLHRVYKRLDREAEYELASLRTRRVTG